MKPLIEIQNVPISMEFRVSTAQVERASNRTEIEISRDRRGLSMRSSPIRLSVDTFEARNSISPTATRSIEQRMSDRIQTVFDAATSGSREGTNVLDMPLRQNPMPQISAERLISPPADFNIKWLPEQPANMNIHDQSFRFTPANIEFTITQHPKVIIEFIGEPIYVPPSANPDYEPAVDILT